MPYRKVQFAQGQFYHIYNRGVGRQPIFREEENYLFLLRRVNKYASAFHIAVITYCLMPNHYHFLLRQDDQIPAGRLPQRVFNSYTKAFNKRYDRTGTLFEGPYKAIHVDQDHYLLHLCRYIHANPVKHGLVYDLEQWPYSNYMEWVGARNGKLVDHTFAREHFPVTESYRQFVLGYLDGLDKLPTGIEDYLLE
jgi:REP element-mobilizing transposase RayT